jgi:hypothetical protein
LRHACRAAAPAAATPAITIVLLQHVYEDLNVISGIAEVAACDN